MHSRHLFAFLALFSGSQLCAQEESLNSTPDMAVEDPAIAENSSITVSAPKVFLVIARPTNASKSRPSELSWIDAFVHEYLFFRLRAVSQMVVYDPDTLFAYISDYRSYEQRQIPDGYYRSCAETIRATHLLKIEYSLTKNNSSVQFFIHIEPFEGGQSATSFKSGTCAIDKINEELDAAIGQLISRLNIKPDQHAAKFLKTNVTGTGKCNKEIGDQVTELYRHSKQNHHKVAEELKKCALQEEGALLAYFISAREYAKAGENGNAAIALKELIFKLGPSYAALYPLAARYFRMSEQLENALQMIKVCQGLGLSTPDLVLEKALIFEAMDDEANATKAYEEVLLFDPSNFKALLFLMQQYNKQGDPNRALECANRFIRLFPSDGRGDLQAGKAYFSLQQNSSAITALTKAADLLSSEAEPRMLLGDLNALDRNYAEALRQYDRALELKGEDPDLYVKIGEAYLLMGKPELALEKLKPIKKKYYDNTAVLRVIGLSEYQTGDAAAARTDLSRYVENGPPDRSAYLALGELEEQHNEYGKAMNLYEKAKLLDPSDPAVQEHISSLREKMGGREYASGEDNIKDETAYAPRKVSPRFTIGMISGAVFLAGVGGGVAMDRLLKKDYDSYRNEQNTDNVNTQHKNIEQKKLYRNILYAIGGASGVGLTLTIAIPLLR